jgi:uncharacterized protein (TIGR02646 family)
MEGVRAVLRTMAGERERCMYCEDSRGTDIEHFWPRGGEDGDPGRAFRWENLLLSCGGCNDAKGTRFPTDDAGAPVLLDPTSDYPMEHLYFDPPTGQLAPAFDASGTPSCRGEVTLAVLHTLNSDPVTKGRQRTYRSLRRAVVQAIQGRSSRDELLETVGDNGQYGLARWFFLGGGASHEPFATLARQCRDLWTEAQAVARTATQHLARLRQ